MVEKGSSSKKKKEKEMDLTLLGERRNRTSNESEKELLSMAAHVIGCDRRKGCDDKRSHGKECNGCQERGGEDASSVEKREIGEMSSKISFEGEQQEEGGQRADAQVEAVAREEVDAEDADSEVEELSTVVFEPGMLVLVQNNKYQWPGRVVDVGANSLFRVQLFDKPGLYDGKLRSFDSAAVKVFQYSNELDDIAQTSTNNELKQAFRKALRIFYGLE